MPDTAIETLEKGKYISFATLKKSGDFVPTPVWFAPDGDSYYLFSAGDAGKVKRLRNFDRVRIAPCTVSGSVTGDWIETRAYLLDEPEDMRKALAALRRKYTWQMRLARFALSLTGRWAQRAAVEIRA